MMRINHIFKRFKHKNTHWSMEHKKIFPKDRALQNFDDFYGSVFGNRWKSIRIALLSEHKYIALVNNFGDTDKTITRLENDGAMCLRRLYEVGKQQLNEQSLMVANASHTAIDTKLGQFVRRQQSEELSSIYNDEQKLDHIPDSLDITSDGSNEKKILTKQKVSDFKKSLSQAIEEDSVLDIHRIVDGSVGASGLHEFIPATKIKGMEDWVLESDHYKYYSNSADFPLNIEMENELEIPENLHLYTYEKGNISQFMRPKNSATGVLTHFCMDGGSVLPPLALNIQPGDRVLDACAAPGGKSLIMLQSLYPELLVCNDVQESRVARINKIMHQYIYDFEEKWRSKRCIVTQQDCRVLNEYNMYDKILVDVPCTNDRNSVTENDNNIFKPTRLKERLRLPELQAGMLSNCLRLLKPGGSLVYSTCSLSPVQNDGVVHMALSNVFKEFGLTVTIKDLSLVMQPLDSIFKFEHPKGLKYGQMVLPILTANFGPMYFSKMTRIT